MWINPFQHFFCCFNTVSIPLLFDRSLSTYVNKDAKNKESFSQLQLRQIFCYQHRLGKIDLCKAIEWIQCIGKGFSLIYLYRDNNSLKYTFGLRCFWNASLNIFFPTAFLPTEGIQLSLSNLHWGKIVGFFFRKKREVRRIPKGFWVVRNFQ